VLNQTLNLILKSGGGVDDTDPKQTYRRLKMETGIAEKM
jgi:hypothetical protein